MGKKIIRGVNDLATLHPALLAEWDFERNGRLDPWVLAPSSSEKTWWKCEHNHRWQVTVSGRAYGGSGCPHCSGRRVTPGVNDLRTTHPEIARELHPARNGTDTDETLSPGTKKPVWWLCPQGHEYRSQVGNRTSREDGCPFCAGRYAIEGETDLVSQFPLVAKEWDFERNAPALPSEVKPASNQNFWWRCRLGHTWRTNPAKRTVDQQGCPYCSNQKILSGFNDLKTLYPDLAKEWIDAKNAPITPTDVGAGTQKKFWWNCSLGHEFYSAVNGRVRGRGCPTCATHGYDPTLPANLYLLESERLGARKIGISNNLKSRLEKYEKKDWEVVRIFPVYHGATVKAVERATFEWLRNEHGLGQALEKREMGRAGGWTETFSISGPTNQEIEDHIDSHLARLIQTSEED